MKENSSNIVKNDIFEVLSTEKRYKSILDKVVEELKNGNAPVVIESWSGKFKKIKPTDSIWTELFEEKSKDMVSLFKDNTVEFHTRSYLDGNVRQDDFTPVIVSVIVKQAGDKIYQHATHATEELVNSLTYFGHRDKNYLTLIFKQLGYKVWEGDVAGKSGLLIALGE